MEVDINGVKHEIETVHFPEQPQQYHDAVAKDDYIKAMIWRKPPMLIYPHLIQSEINSLQIKSDYEYKINK